MWRRVRPYVALALATGASLALWRALETHGAELAAELDTTNEPSTLPAGAASRGAVPAASVPRSPLAPRVRLVEVARGFDKPLFATHAGDGSGRLFVVEQGGRIRIVVNGRVAERPYLDLSRVLDTDAGERGLLGLAFAPDYARSGRFFVAHTVSGAVRVARMHVSGDPDVAATDSTTILEMDDPASNHNGGMLAFGPDGMLWIGTGDGGRAGDPWDNARDPKSWLGKMLRLDVSEGAGERYAIPPDNPFVRRSGYAPEIWALGLRNPWRYSFDRATGELWIGDVGQHSWEEIDVVDSRRGGGAHFGWKAMEGFHCHSPSTGCDATGLTAPVHAYGRGDGCSVTGGYVYRGRALPELVGEYLFGDYCTGRVWTLRRDGGSSATVALLLESGASISSFGEDEAGELYLCDHVGGRVLRFAPAG
jgi:glucose/arabinose dehydrogenase